MRIRAAEPDDVEAIAAIVERAYGVYVERIGLRPGPMDDDYGEQVRRGLAHVAVDGAAGGIVGLIVLEESGDRLVIENLALYARLGYEEDERRRVTAFGREFSRVFMSKPL